MLVDSYGMLGKGIQEAIEIHNSRLGQMRRAMQQNEETIRQQQIEIEDLKRKLRAKEDAEAKNGDLIRRLEREAAERLRRLEREFSEKERFLQDKYAAEAKANRDAMSRMSDQVESQLRTITELNNIVSDHERTIARLMGDLKNADSSFGEYREKFSQMDEENKQLQRLLDEATLKRESTENKLRVLEDQVEHARGNLWSALDNGDRGAPGLTRNAGINELAQKASAILIDLRDRESGFSKKDAQANAALSSAANKILALERDLQTYHQALHDTVGGLETSLAGVDSAVVQQALRDSKHAIRSKGGRPTAVDEDKILYCHDLVNLVNVTVQILGKSQKRSAQLLKLVHKKNEMLVMVGTSLRNQVVAGTDALAKELNETATAYAAWASEVMREVPVNPLTSLLPVAYHQGNSGSLGALPAPSSSLAVVFERMGASTNGGGGGGTSLGGGGGGSVGGMGRASNYSSDSLLANVAHNMGLPRSNLDNPTTTTGGGLSNKHYTSSTERTTTYNLNSSYRDATD